MARITKAWPAALSATLLCMSFAPLGWRWLVFVALVPWFSDLRHVRGRAAWRSGYCFGFVVEFFQLHWFGELTQRWTHSFLLSLVPWLLGCLVGALYFGVLGVLVSKCWRLGWPIAIPFVWVGVEFVRCYVPYLSFPWTLLGVPLGGYPALIQAAFFGQVFLVSAWVALINVTFAIFFTGESPRKLAPYAYVCLAVLALSLARYVWPSSTGKPVDVAVGQLGLDMGFGEQDAFEAQLPVRVNQMYDAAEAANASLLVLPEGVVSSAQIEGALPFQVRSTVPILFGAQRGKGPKRQSAFLYDGQWQVADKTRLVIFGEYVPLRHQLPFLSAFDLPGLDLTPGEHVRYLTLKGLRIGPLLCFEELFPDLAYRQGRAGAGIVAVLSVDDWFAHNSAIEQIRDATVFRAVESGAPLVRSSTQGYSFATDARGRIVAQAPFGPPSEINAYLAPNKSGPPIWQPVFPFLGVVCTFLVAAAPVRRRKRRSSTPG